MKRFMGYSQLAFILVILLAANLIGYLLLNRIKADLTEEKLYTLSQGSRNILKNLDDVITARYYYSATAMRDEPGLKQYANTVRDLLREYEENSNGKFKLEVIDPLPDSDEQVNAERFGLKQVRIPNSPDPIYIGLALRDESAHEHTIPFLDPRRLQHLEYDISKALFDLAHPEKQTVGLISSLPVMGDPAAAMMPQQRQGPRPWVFVQQLKESYDLKEIQSDATELPSGLNLLIVYHPKNVSEDLQFAIDQYVLGGGNAIVFIDPFSQQEMMASQLNANDYQAQMQADYASNMPELLKAWGLKLMEEKKADNGPMGAGGGAQVVGDTSLALSVNTNQGPMKYPIWLQLTDKNRDPSDIATSELENIMMIAPGGLEVTSGTAEQTPLLFTSNKGQLIDSFMLRFTSDPEMLRKQLDEKGGGEKITLACKVSGKFKTAFPDRAAKDEKLTQSSEPATVIVVADTDMLGDQFSVNIQNMFGMQMLQLLNDNLPLFLNMTEHMTGSQDLIALRSRGKSQREFTRIREIEEAANERWAAEAKELEEKLAKMAQEINQLNSGSDDKVLLNQELIKRISSIREEQANARMKLREVRFNLRQDVERLQNRIKFLNIFLTPAMVAFVGFLIVGTWRFRRSKG
ncbi:Gldg family protein [Candidatus Sumerlaeota bacterium]|nr:Gldg family protein [Candidatus Sumerlaeota bacterium]